MTFSNLDSGSEKYTCLIVLFHEWFTRPFLSTIVGEVLMLRTAIVSRLIRSFVQMPGNRISSVCVWGAVAGKICFDLTSMWSLKKRLQLPGRTILFAPCSDGEMCVISVLQIILRLEFVGFATINSVIEISKISGKSVSLQ